MRFNCWMSLCALNNNVPSVWVCSFFGGGVGDCGGLTTQRYSVLSVPANKNAVTNWHNTQFYVSRHNHVFAFVANTWLPQKQSRVSFWFSLNQKPKNISQKPTLNVFPFVKPQTVRGTKRQEHDKKDKEHDLFCLLCAAQQQTDDQTANANI